MKSSNQLFRRLPVWLDWRISATGDALFLLGMGAIIFVVATVYDLPPYLLQFGLDYAEWEADDAIFVVFVLSVGFMIYGFRRYRELSGEIKARISAESEARKLARHDPLTGLPNRRFFEEQLEQCLSTASATHQVAVLLLDLDGFKSVNDSYGHPVGDKALSELLGGSQSSYARKHFLPELVGTSLPSSCPKSTPLMIPQILRGASRQPLQSRSLSRM